MRDKILAYALAVSVGVHIIILCVVGKTSAARPIDVEELKLVRVDMVRLPEEPASAPPDTPKPTPKPSQPEPEHVSIPPPEKIPTAPRPRPRPVDSGKRRQQPANTSRRPEIPSPIYATRPGRTVSDRSPGNPGGGLNLGSTTPHGENLGTGGRTPVGWVPGNPGGSGSGSGNGPGAGKPEPVPDAVEGPGREPAPPPPPPSPDVDVRVCAESGMRPGRDCERIVTRSFRLGKEPAETCKVCKKHVSTLADRSVPELVSGRKRPKYPDSARMQGIEGSVSVEYTINTEGDVTGVKVSSSSGNSDLDRAAVDAVKSRKYKPAVQAGIPRNYRKRETFHFTLD